jgi:hypothetical protein
MKSNTLTPPRRKFGRIITPEFANVIDRAEPILGPDPDRGYRHGQVFFANDSRFMESFYSEPLTNYMVGWRDPNNIEDTLQFFAPAVPVGRAESQLPPAQGVCFMPVWYWQANRAGRFGRDDPTGQKVSGGRHLFTLHRPSASVSTDYASSPGNSQRRQFSANSFSLYYNCSPPLEWTKPPVPR